jgi:hypothetical protein
MNKIFIILILTFYLIAGYMLYTAGIKVINDYGVRIGNIYQYLNGEGYHE